MNVKDVLGCVATALFLLLASVWFPLFGTLICLLTPLPFLYYSTKLGFHNGIGLAFATVLIVGIAGFLTGYSQAILFCIELCALGLALSEIFRRKLSLGQAILFGTLFMLLLSMGHLFVVSLSRDMGPLEMMLDYLHAHLKMTIAAYEEMGMPHENAVDLESYARAVIDTVYPSLMIVGTGFAIWLNIVVAKPFFRRGKLKYPDFIPMDRWQTPEMLIWGLIASGFSLFLLQGIIQSAAANVLIVLMAVYLFHGLSIIVFFFNKYRLPNWVRIGIFFLIVIQQLFLVLLALAGVFDQWIDFRRLHKESEMS